MAGVHRQAQRPAEVGGHAEVGERVEARRVRIAPGVQFNGHRSQLLRLLNHRLVRVNEQRGADAGCGQPGQRGAQPLRVARDVQPALSRHFFAALRHQGHLVRAQPFGDAEHLIGARHLEVERGTNDGEQGVEVGVLDMTAVLAQVRGDAVGAGGFAEHCGGGGVGFIGAARLTEGGDVIDVDEEAEVRRVRWCAAGCCH